MVHVPELRKFSKDAREYITDVAWAVAMESAAKLKPQPTRLAVGIRGAFLYDTVTEGHIVAEDKASQDGIEQRHTGSSPQKYLEAFFEESNAVDATLPKPGAMMDEPEKEIAQTVPVKAAIPPPQKLDVLPTPVRDWKDSTGRVMQASLESFTTPAKDVGRFKRADGQVFEVPFSRLSAEDQAFIRDVGQRQ